MSNHPLKIAINAQHRAAECAVIARDCLAMGETERAARYQFFAEDWAAQARFNLLLALHDDVDVAEEAFDDASDASTENEGAADVVACLMRRSGTAPTEHGWRYIEANARFARAVRHRMLEMEQPLAPFGWGMAG